VGEVCASCAQKSELLTAFQTARSEAEQAFRKSERLHGEIDRTSAAYRVSKCWAIGTEASFTLASGSVRFSGGIRSCSRKSPSPVLDAKVRKRMGRSGSPKRSRKIGYSSAGTVEFLREESGKTLLLFEMNARIQVEHPVTEMGDGRGSCENRKFESLQERNFPTVVGPRRVFEGIAIECPHQRPEDPDTFVSIARPAFTAFPGSRRARPSALTTRLLCRCRNSSLL